MLIDYLFHHLKELMIITLKKTTEILSHIIMYQGSNKRFHVSIDGKNLFDLPIRNEEGAYEKIIHITNKNDYTTDNLLDFAYYKKNYSLIAIDLSKQTKIKDPQQINFIVKIEGQDNGVTMFFIIGYFIKGQKKLLFNFYKIL